MAAPLTAREARVRPERIRLLDVDADRIASDITGLDAYRCVRVLVRLHGAPVAMVDVPVRDGTCTAVDLEAAVRAALAGRRAHDDRPERTDRAETPGAGSRSTAPAGATLPPLTVAVCTRDRPDDLADCLDALLRLDYPDLEILVVDNAPATQATADVCAARAGVRRVVEPRPGLDWARNRAVLEASGDIIAFTDDDARADPDWARNIVAPFVADPHVMAVAGLIVPLELETPAQILFEEYGGLSGGFAPITLRPGADWGVRGVWHYALMAPHGSGANMAFRRSVFASTGWFDPALDVGTPTNGGGDTEMLFRVMAHGHALAYEPRAIVRHRHRRDLAGLRRQVAGWGSGLFAFLMRSMTARPAASWVLGLVGMRSLAHQAVRLVRPGGIPRSLILTELRGVAESPARYLLARSRARSIERRFGPQEPGGTVR